MVVVLLVLVEVLMLPSLHNLFPFAMSSSTVFDVCVFSWRSNGKTNEG